MTVISTPIQLKLSTGAVNTVSNPNVNACQLTPNRMVIYSTESPYKRMLTIVDNPNGLSSSTAPTVTYNAYMDSNSAPTSGQSVKMERLSDDTFMIMSPGNKAKFTLTLWIIDVFKVSGTTITKVSTTTDQNFTFQSRCDSKFNQNLHVAPFQDNEILVAYQRLDFSNTYYPYGLRMYWACRRGVWNPSQSTWSWDNYKVGNIIPIGDLPQSWGQEGIDFPTTDIQYIDIWSTKNPSGGRLFQAKTSNLSNYGTVANYNYQGTWQRNDYRGVFMANASDTWTNTTIQATGDLTTMFTHGDSSIAYTDWKYHTFTGSRSGLSLLNGETQINTRNSAGGQGNLHVLPIDRDFYIMINRQFFIANNTTAAPFTMKVVRRTDSTLLDQNPASVGKAVGFKVTVPWSDILWDKTRPWLNENNDICWWGVDPSGKFVITTIKQPSLPQ